MKKTTALTPILAGAMGFDLDKEMKDTLKKIKNSKKRYGKSVLESDEYYTDENGCIRKLESKENE